MNATNIVGQIHQFHLTQIFTLQISAMYNTLNVLIKKGQLIIFITLQRSMLLFLTVTFNFNILPFLPVLHAHCHQRAQPAFRIHPVSMLLCPVFYRPLEP